MGAENMDVGEAGRTFTHGFWAVAFIDLLGQKNAFLKTDYLPDESDPEKRAAFVSAVQASVDAIRGMRKIISNFQVGLRSTEGDDAFGDLPPEKREAAERIRRARVREFHLSDGLVLACPLMQAESHFPMRGVYGIVAACTAIMPTMLSGGSPVRGGLDVGTGVEIDKELFGASLVKAYELESKRAKYPRIVVGQQFVNYLGESIRTPRVGIESETERRMASTISRLLKKDSDGETIIDWAGDSARELVFKNLQDVFFGDARKFAEKSREEFRGCANKEGETLFERYSKLVRYMDASGVK
jgi:hypothetical protein